MRTIYVAPAVAALLACDPALIGAHFKLLEPASWLVSSDRGDPQKPAPADATKPSDKGWPSQP